MKMKKQKMMILCGECGLARTLFLLGGASANASLQTRRILIFRQFAQFFLVNFVHSAYCIFPKNDYNIRCKVEKEIKSRLKKFQNLKIFS